MFSAIKFELTFMSFISLFVITPIVIYVFVKKIFPKIF